MSKFKFGSRYKNIVTQFDKDTEAKEAVESEKRTELTNAIVNIGSGPYAKGGAGTGVMVCTEAYNKWLVENQKRNPFIGKSYMQRADEFARDDEEVKKTTAMSDEDAAKALEIDEDGTLHISDDFDPNNVEAVENEKLVGDAAKLSDLCIINSVISKQISWDFESLMEEVTKTLNDFHIDDTDFELPENLTEQVDTALKRYNALQLLSYSKDDPTKNAENQEK